MIELRWYPCLMTDDLAVEMGGYCYKLQSRSLELYDDCGETRSEWSDWQDVKIEGDGDEG